ncbi:MAG: hypothetical protein OEY52_13080 [Gammaproteobacteria bacterium]|nr:hypothetical protein [Gammaproteobacteria bacterium]
MNMTDEFLAIRKLCEDYCELRISKEEYREKRSLLLNEIDEHYNNLSQKKDAFNEPSAGMVNKIFSIFKSKDEEKVI